MFSFVTETWNPVAGECPYECSYCWAKGLINRYGWEKYRGPGRLAEGAMRKVPDKGFVFVQDMSDISILDLDSARLLLTELAWRKDATYLLLTKNPGWYRRMVEGGADFLGNVVLGATIETNRDISISKAPSPRERLEAMGWVAQHLPNKTFISVEPIMNFDRDKLLPALSFVRPWSIAIGYDNYKNHLPEPSLAKTLELIDSLEKRGIKVYRKTLREKWNS